MKRLMPYKEGYKMNRRVVCIAMAGLLLAAAVLLACSQPSPDGAQPADAGGGGAVESQVSRLDAVKARGRVICASNNSIPGFGYIDEGGNNAGFDIDLCRAVAAATLGDADAIEIVPVNATEMGATIQSGDVDMLVRTVTRSSSRDAQWGNFSYTMYYDGQGFLVRKALGLTSSEQLAGSAVCVTQGTTTELNLQDFSNLHNLGISAVNFEKTDAAVEAYRTGQCDAFTTDHSGLYAYRSSLPNPDEHIVLPDTISEEPLAPVVPHGDERWIDIVNFTMSILIYAEAYGYNSGNVPTTLTGNSKVDRLFGLEGSYGQETLGLSATVAQDVVLQVGNYAEIYDRNLGVGGIGLPRTDGTRNALWSAAPCTDCPKGGQIYAAPLR